MVSTSVSRSEEEGEESAEGEVGIMSASRSIISPRRPRPPAPAENRGQAGCGQGEGCRGGGRHWWRAKRSYAWLETACAMFG